MTLFRNWVKSIFEFALGLLFPRSSVERALGKLTPAKLRTRFKETINLPNSGGRALFPYKDKFIREMIWLLKYRENAHALNLFAALLGESIIAECEEILPFCANPRIILVPIPSTNKRVNERGYNHTLLLSEKMVEVYGRDFFEIAPDILIFGKEIKRQTSCKNKKEREENMKGAFTISKNKTNTNFSGRLVVIIDDVSTTGATFKDAVRALKTLGAANNPKQIKCFALSH